MDKIIRLEKALRSNLKRIAFGILEQNGELHDDEKSILKRIIAQHCSPNINISLVEEIIETPNIMEVFRGLGSEIAKLLKMYKLELENFEPPRIAPPIPENRDLEGLYEMQMWNNKTLYNFTSFSIFSSVRDKTLKSMCPKCSEDLELYVERRPSKKHDLLRLHCVSQKFPECAQMKWVVRKIESK